MIINSKSSELCSDLIATSNLLSCRIRLFGRVCKMRIWLEIKHLIQIIKNGVEIFHSFFFVKFS
jgi:hypothetical protein